MPRLAIPCLLLLFATGVGMAQSDAGIDLVTIGSLGNAPWPGDGTGGDLAIGRGQVDYPFRLGQDEVTTEQWTNFFNAAYDRPQADWIPFLTPPTYWGALPTTPNTPGGMLRTVPAGHDMYPVGNISWRMAAIFCNWLCHGAPSSPDRSAFLNGAYDVSTFGYVGDRFTDQLTHNPGAQYWIPTLDEWIKAAHFDPNRYGQGQPGWWVYSNRTNTPLIGGPPGTGQANFGFNDGSQFSIPLGSYPQTQSPWGLYDMAGGTSGVARRDNNGIYREHATD